MPRNEKSFPHLFRGGDGRRGHKISFFPRLIRLSVAIATRGHGEFFHFALANFAISPLSDAWAFGTNIPPSKPPLMQKRERRATNQTAVVRSRATGGALNPGLASLFGYVLKCHSRKYRRGRNFYLKVPLLVLFTLTSFVVGTFIICAKPRTWYTVYGRKRGGGRYGRATSSTCTA